VYPGQVMPIRSLLIILLATACSDYSVVQRTNVDSWRQPAREEGIDILWVVDDSATMFEEQDLLAASADAFIGFVANSAVDFRLGLISTDMDDDPGMLLGPVLTPDTVGLVDAFVAQIDEDFAGSRNERGIDAAILGSDPAHNPDFARKKADLEVVVFSDEDDHSEIDVADVVAQLESQRSNASIKLHAVVGDPPAGCVSALAAADAGTRYLELSKQTEGRRESICTNDYGSMLARIALDVIGLETVFALNLVPNPDTIELRVDGVMPINRRVDGWWYNPGDNTIRFDGYAVPPPGADITARYAEWLGPDDALEEEEEEEEEDTP
jgi:hypothetical protein